MNEIQVGSTMTNGHSAMRITGRDSDQWAGIYISLETGTETGAPCGMPDHMLRKHWRHVPFEWTPLGDSGLEERYVWTADHRALRHETRALVTA